MFLHGNGGIEDSDESRFQLAVSANGYSLDEEGSRFHSPQENGELGLIFPDGVTLFVLDNEKHNFWRWELLHTPNLGKTDFTGAKMGFEPSRNSDAPLFDTESGVYGISYHGLKGPGITEDGIDNLDEFRIITNILKNGKHDREAASKLSPFLESSGRGKDLSTDPEVVLNSLPYFNKIMDTTLKKEGLQERFIWDQYWHSQQQGPTRF